MTKENRWVPVLKGKTFCSPGCGASCTKVAHDTAHKQAKTLATTLKKITSKEWVPRVWENLGWHYSVTIKEGDLTIHPADSSSKNYSIYSHCNGTPAQVSTNSSGPDLKKLIENQLEIVKLEAKRWNTYLKRNEI